MKYTDLLELCKALQARNSLLTEASAQVVRGVRSGNWKSCHEDVAALAEALAAPVDPEQSMLAEYLALQEVSREAVGEADQLRVQLTGCSVAALGGSPQAVPGDYGWSPAYQDVVELRKKLDRLNACDMILEALINAFMIADRMGAEKDEPEGTRWIQLSDTCVNDVILAKLRSIQKEFQNA